MRRLETKFDRFQESIDDLNAKFDTMLQFIRLMGLERFDRIDARLARIETRFALDARD
ncbi:MAG: hypothetical protein NW215_02630 [Hyphomicrobiales bacterium]|nr:hypothetical protein [Hyphomicrobiales bacterium]